MKKKLLLPVITLIMVFFSITVALGEAETMFAIKDNVKVYKEQDKDTKVIRKLKAGEQILVEDWSSDREWVGILVESKKGGQILGWIKASNLSYTMPSNLCDHQWTDWYIMTEPTCTRDGMRGRDCPICGIAEAVDIPALGHSFGKWSLVKDATCTSEGQRVRTCQVCGEQETETLPKLAHNFGDWKVTKEATCTLEGERVHKCKDCGLEEKQTLEKLPHSYGSWTVLKEATYTAEGERSHKYVVCGFESKEAIPMIPHDFKWDVIVEATDHSSGIRTNVCQVCGYKEEQVSFDPEGTLRRGDRSEEVREVQQLLADQNYLNNDGADGIFGGGTEKALMEFQDDQGLTPDGVAWPQTIARLHHDFGEWEMVKPLTRDAAGERVRKCKDCDYEQHEEMMLSPYLERGGRGEDVRAAQQMISKIGFDAGAYDGIYGQMLDNAFEGFAKAEGFDFEPGKVLPAQIDNLVNTWIDTISDENWKGESGLNTPVNLALTVAPAQDPSENDTDEITTYTWTLTNMGSENCVFTTLLLNFGTNPDFRSENFVMDLDGETLTANVGNSVSGSFKANRNWGKGNLNFTALAVSEVTGDTWLSNVEVFDGEEPETELPEAAETESETENTSGILE